MFKTHWWTGKTVSDEGFSIKFISKTGLRYEAGGKSMVITVKCDRHEIDVLHSSMRHWTKDPDAIDAKADEANVDNVTRALESRGFERENRHLIGRSR